MAALPNGFVQASDADSGTVTNLAIHQEISEIERIILVQSSNGFLSVNVTSTLMTSNATNAPLTVTDINTTNNTVTIPGLAALARSGCGMSCCSLIGLPVIFSSTNNLPTPLQTDTTYYVVPVAGSTDVYQISATKQGTFQCPPVILALGITPTVVTGTQSISGTVTGTVSNIGSIGVTGSIIINGVSVPVASTDTLADIAADINAANITNIMAYVAYTYSQNCQPSNSCCNCGCSNRSGNGQTTYSCKCSGQPTITGAKLVITNTANGAVSIGGGSTSALLTALGLTAGNYGSVNYSGNLIIDGVTIAVSATDTLATLVSNINAASIPNVTASTDSTNSYLILTDSTGAVITLAGTSQVLAALGLTAGSTAPTVVSATLIPQSQLYYNAWTNLYFFPEQRMYTTQMQDVINYFSGYGYNISQLQQTDANGNPLPCFSWSISW